MICRYIKHRAVVDRHHGRFICPEPQAELQYTASIDTGGELVVRDSDYTLGMQFTLSTVSEQDVLRQVTALRKGFAPGLDGVSANLHS
ncbi:hypothetical protein J6590_078705 [Homalodisca vitripennis]|nr:hypothetical protein J6590_078705 [Homalodisca vitripennis]